MAGQDAVLSALGTRSGSPPFSRPAANLVDAMKKHDVRRLVCLTGVGAGDSKGHVGFLYDRIFLPLMLRNQYEDKDRQEEILRGSGLKWVIVRPARVTDKRATGEYQVFLRRFLQSHHYISGGRGGLHACSTDRGSLRTQDACDQLLSKPGLC